MTPKERKEQILATARQVFAEKGFYNTGIGDICREVHISRGTLYQYFANKQEVFREVLRRFMDALEAYMTPPTPGLSPENFGYDEMVVHLTERLALIYSAVARGGDLVKILYLEAGALRGEVTDLTENIDSRFVGLIERELRVLAERGFFRIEDVPVAARIVLGGVFKVSIDLILEGEDVRKVAGATARLLAGGLVAPGSVRGESEA